MGLLRLSFGLFCLYLGLNHDLIRLFPSRKDKSLSSYFRFNLRHVRSLAAYLTEKTWHELRFLHLLAS
jgi:hypothetical protein